MRIAVLDPGLMRVAGHHFDIDLRVCRELVRSGHEVTLYTATNLAEEIKDSLSNVCLTREVFTQFPYTDSSTIDKIAGSLILFQRQTRIIANELQLVSEADLFLFPTIFPAHLNACAVAKLSTPIVGCVHERILEVNGLNEMFWRYAMLHLKSVGVPFHIGVIEPELLIPYQKIALDDFRIKMFPIPHDGLAAGHPRSQLRTIGFLGHQRLEKGSFDIGALATSLVERSYSVLVHDSSDLLVDQLPKQVERISFVADFAKLIATCDCVVLPYHLDQYKQKGSGVLWEAMASGVPIVAPLGTAPGRWVSRYDNGVLFPDRTALSVLGAIDDLEKHFDVIAQKAFIVSQNWLGDHGTSNFCKSVTELVDSRGAMN